MPLGRDSFASGAVPVRSLRLRREFAHLRRLNHQRSLEVIGHQGTDDLQAQSCWYAAGRSRAADRCRCSPSPARECPNPAAQCRSGRSMALQAVFDRVQHRRVDHHSDGRRLAMQQPHAGGPCRADIDLLPRDASTPCYTQCTVVQITDVDGPVLIFAQGTHGSPDTLRMRFTASPNCWRASSLSLRRAHRMRRMAIVCKLFLARWWTSRMMADLTVQLALLLHRLCWRAATSAPSMPGPSRRRNKRPVSSAASRKGISCADMHSGSAVRTHLHDHPASRGAFLQARAGPQHDVHHLFVWRNSRSTAARCPSTSTVSPAERNRLAEMPLIYKTVRAVDQIDAIRPNDSDCAHSNSPWAHMRNRQLDCVAEDIPSPVMAFVHRHILRLFDQRRSRYLPGWRPDRHHGRSAHGCP